MTALPPSFVLDTAMFAMLMPARPNSVPTWPITPGRSSYWKNTMSGASSISILKPSAPTSQCRLSPPNVVPATVVSSPFARRLTSTRLV